jgi:DNA-binding MarR family transcriptional regulator
VPEAVVDALMRASRALAGITTRSIASVNDDVTLAQFRTLTVLSLQGPQPVGALAEHLDVHASTMTRMCNRLVARGLIERAPSSADRREVVVTLSVDGSALVAAVMDRRRQILELVVQQMTPEGRHAAIDALETFARAAGEVPEEEHETL